MCLDSTAKILDFKQYPSGSRHFFLSTALNDEAPPCRYGREAPALLIDYNGVGG